MRPFRLLLAAAALALLLASRASAPPALGEAEGDAAPTAKSTSTVTPPPHASEIRFAILGGVTDANVWMLFNAAGSNYWDYAVRSDYWPRLYRLSIPGREFEPMAADGAPSALTREGDFYTAAVRLRPDLTWTDGTPFSAEDVAFTVSTALAFQLGFDWKAFYDPGWLERVEAVDPHTVKFYFKQAPHVGAWQYGALQGPILQKSYWEPKIVSAIALLPNSSLSAQMVDFQARTQTLQIEINELQTTLSDLPRNTEEYRRTDGNIKRKQGDLDKANNDLTKAQEEYAAALNSAQAALYALGDSGEPTLGMWMPAENQNGVFASAANPKFPFGRPSFDRAAYRVFANEAGAVAALRDGEVDVLLSPSGLSEVAAKGLSGDSSIVVSRSPSRSARFLVFNHASSFLADPALHLALSCMIDRTALAGRFLQENAESLESFVVSDAGGWYNPKARSLCDSLDLGTRLQQSVGLLKSAGYTWAIEPLWDEAAGAIVAGKGLITPSGTAFPSVTLLAPSAEYDPLRAAAAGYIEQQANLLGIPLTKRLISSEDLRYAVYSSGRYDMAILGWRLSEYPRYLCDWFQDGNPFHYNGSRLKPACAALERTSDIETARARVFEIQSILAEDLPLIPLYSDVTYDAYRSVYYPFASVLDGLTGLYGAPSLAVPIQ